MALAVEGAATARNGAFGQQMLDLAVQGRLASMSHTIAVVVEVCAESTGAQVRAASACASPPRLTRIETP